MRCNFWFLLLSILAGFCLPAVAEGSRNLYPSGTSGNRANTEWRDDVYGGIVKRRTLLKVYAQQGEYLLMGSTAVGVGSGNIWVYNPDRVTGKVGEETIPNTPNFQCTSQAGRGAITSRTQELAGPRSIDPITLPSTYGNSTGYTPCYYQVPETGIYDVVIIGTVGLGATGDGAPTADVDIGTPATKPNNFSNSQGSSIAAWDITVRSSRTSTSDITGRLFTYYLALFTGGNGRPIYPTIYPVTVDGYRYKTEIRGLDPNGFVLYGNEVGFFDSDGASTLYHNIVGDSGQLTTRDGGTRLSYPQFPIFFNQADPTSFPFIKIYDRDGNLTSTGLPIAPIIPTITDVSFLGTIGQNDTELTKGGYFRFRSSTKGRYQIIVKGSGSSDFEALNPKNRFIQGDLTAPGNHSIPWDGKDNAGNDFPIGNGYSFQIRIVGGEYHFPLIDAENNFFGGPTITLLNPPAAYPSDPPSFGTNTAFYDDRVYKTKGGTIVHVGATQTNINNNDPLCGIGAPTIRFSDPVKGFNSTTNQRAFGQNNGGNTNTRCTGSFGDTKGLDLWTFFPRGYQANSLNILSTAPTKMLLVKRITAINGSTGNTLNGENMSLFNDDASTNNQDNFLLWPDSDGNPNNNSNTYLRGAIDGGRVQTNDEVEYTIYFLITNDRATNIKICDLVPKNMTFVANAFGTSQGIALGLSNTALPTIPTDDFTNSSDGDRGTYYPPNTAPPTGCKKPDPNNPNNFINMTATDNTNGLVVVDVVNSPTFLPEANTAGNPTNSYGFIRFKGMVIP
jgi:uncharacterized repeat protein (TIGR01451 family)